MSTFWEPTRAGSERKTKMITLDSESYFTSSNSTSIHPSALHPELRSQRVNIPSVGRLPLT